MKRCPECRRDYSDDTLLYCLEDGAELVQGSVPFPEEPQTVRLHETAAPNEAATREVPTTEQTAVLPSGISETPRKGFDKRLIDRRPCGHYYFVVAAVPTPYERPGGCVTAWIQSARFMA